VLGQTRENHGEVDEEEEWKGEGPGCSGSEAVSHLNARQIIPTESFFLCIALCAEFIVEFT
jgi:hypothetical protein